MRHFILCFILLTSCTNSVKKSILYNEYSRNTGRLELNYQDSSFYYAWKEVQRDDLYFAVGTFIKKEDTIILKSSRGCSCDFEFVNELKSTILVKSNNKDLVMIKSGKEEHIFPEETFTMIVNNPIDTIHITHWVKNGRGSLDTWVLPSNYYNVVIQCDFPQHQNETRFDSRELLILRKKTYRDLF